MGQKNINKTQILHKLYVILLIELFLDGKILQKILHKSYRKLAGIVEDIPFPRINVRVFGGFRRMRWKSKKPTCVGFLS